MTAVVLRADARRLPLNGGAVFRSLGMEAAPHAFPFRAIRRTPVDPEPAVVPQQHERDSGVVLLDLTHEVRPQEPVQSQAALCSHGDIGRAARFVMAAITDFGGGQDGVGLSQDGVITVSDAHAQVRGSRAAVAERDAAFAVDDAREPSEIGGRYRWVCWPGRQAAGVFPGLLAAAVLAAAAAFRAVPLVEVAAFRDGRTTR